MKHTGKQVNVHLPPALVRDFKVVAAKLGLKLYEAYEAALRAWVKNGGK